MISRGGAGTPPGRPEARAEVEVAVSPDRAFEAFTAEISAWWVPGPINFFDARRSPTMRVECRPGGRVLEVYPDGELVIAEITVWEPGVRLSYRGIVDDSQTDVSFDRSPAGTTVRLHQYLRDDGDRAFLFWPNVIGWLVPWCDDDRRPDAAPPSHPTAQLDRNHGGSAMTDPVEILRTARTVVLHDWPSEDVPNALVGAGLDITFQGGPEPDDLYVTRLVDGRQETERVSRLPDHADIVYSHRPIDDMPRLLEEARRLGASTLWHQSGLDERGEKDPAGVHLTEDEAEQRAALAHEVGVDFVSAPYIVEAAAAVRGR